MTCDPQCVDQILTGLLNAAWAIYDVHPVWMFTIVVGGLTSCVTGVLTLFALALKLIVLALSSN
jgi:hypothetical protein